MTREGRWSRSRGDAHQALFAGHSATAANPSLDNTPFQRYCEHASPRLKAAPNRTFLAPPLSPPLPPPLTFTPAMAASSAASLASPLLSGSRSLAGASTRARAGTPLLVARPRLAADSRRTRGAVLATAAPEKTKPVRPLPSPPPPPLPRLPPPIRRNLATFFATATSSALLPDFSLNQWHTQSRVLPSSPAHIHSPFRDLFAVLHSQP